MKRILHVVACLERGGTEAFIMNHYRALNRREYQFEFLVFTKKDYPYLEEIRSLGGNVYFAVPPSLRNVGAFVKQAVSIMKAQGPYCAVHSHVNVENAWVMYAAALAGVPVRISHSHDTVGKAGRFPVRIYRKFQEMLIKTFATAHLACSRDAGNDLYGSRFFKKHGKVIHNGIVVEQFLYVPTGETEAIRREFSLPADTELVVGNITRFENKKNQLFAVEVFSHIVRKCPQSVFLMGGPDGGTLESVKRKVSALGLDNHVRFIGLRKDVPACLKLVDVYLFPSLQEGLGIVLLEAQAAGCYCAASTGVSRESDMGLGNVGYLDLQWSAEAWADQILWGFSRKNTVSDGEILDAFAKKGFGVHQSLQELIKVYDNRESLCKKCHMDHCL